MPTPRIVISGISGGAGKTMVALGLARAFKLRGLSVKTFKKGPDYIDAAWLALAAGSPKGNLDPFFCGPDLLRSLCAEGSRGYDLTVIEGNRGLFDGLDLSGSCSTAELARIVGAPVLLVMDCTKMTRTAAALAAGCRAFEPNLPLVGAVLNRTGSERHARLVREAVEIQAGLPVFGVLPRRGDPLITERHMGLAGVDEHSRAESLLDDLAGFLEEHLDLDAILTAARSAPEFPPFPLPEVAVASSPARSSASAPTASPISGKHSDSSVRLGVVIDAALWFYYEENLAALRAAGAEIIPLSLLDPAPWPRIDGLYLGGGLPELHIQALSTNEARRAEVRALAASGLPIYAECGGFMYLAESMRVNGVDHPMAGVLPVAVEMCARPQGLGYVEARVTTENPYHPKGQTLRGHEFHFSRAVAADATHFALALSRGKGISAGCDGIVAGNLFAGYIHIYAPAAPHWAPAFTALCRKVFG
jgi:cobyrinic acid a,c-diamide synthase